MFKIRDLVRRRIMTLGGYAEGGVKTFVPPGSGEFCQDEGCPQHGIRHICVDMSGGVVIRTEKVVVIPEGKKS